MIDPAVLFFAAGVAAKLIRSDLRPLYEALSLYLLLALGLKGGVELPRHPLGELLAQSAAEAGSAAPAKPAGRATAASSSG